MSVNVGGLNAGDVLAALYNGSKAQGMGFMAFNPKPMTREQAVELLCQGGTSLFGGRGDKGVYFDYLQGRVMKLTIPAPQGSTKESLLSDLLPESASIEEWGYDRDVGPGALQRVIDALRRTSEVNADVIKMQHQIETDRALDDVERRMNTPTPPMRKEVIPGLEQLGEVASFELGLEDMKPHLTPAVERAKQAIRG